MANKAEKVRRQ